MNKILLSIMIVLLTSFGSNAQQSDTISITERDVNTNYLKEGTHRYLVYVKMNKNATRTLVQFWTRKIERATENGRAIIKVVQEWEDKDTIIHTTTSISDAKTFKPIKHEYWWKQRGSGSVNMEDKTVSLNGTPITASDTVKSKKAIWTALSSCDEQFYFNWHLDLETFPLLPLKKGLSVSIPFYEPGSSTPLTRVVYTVTGSATLDGYNNQKVDCWLFTHEEKGNKEIFWISKKTRELLKLEQEINGKVYRYKIKLGFSI